MCGGLFNLLRMGIVAGGEVNICTWWTFNSGLIHGDDGVNINCGNLLNQGMITAGKAIGSLLEGTMFEAIPSPFAYVEFLIMLIIALRKFYGGSNEIERVVEDTISISSTLVTTAMTETDSYSASTTEITTTNTISTITSNSSLAMGDEYSLLILLCLVIVFNKV